MVIDYGRNDLAGPTARRDDSSASPASVVGDAPRKHAPGVGPTVPQAIAVGGRVVPAPHITGLLSRPPSRTGPLSQQVGAVDVASRGGRKPNRKLVARFSIIVPIYNIGPYLTPCLESLVTQDCRDAEIILIDDCSKDESGSIADQFAEHFSFVRVIHAPRNEGVAAARNRGLAAASGKYVIFVDGDDCLLENALSGLRRHLDQAGDVDVAVCRFVSEGGVLNNDVLFHPDLLSTRRPEDFLDYVVEIGYHVDHCWNYVIKRSLIDEHRMKFVDAVIGEDAEFIVGLLYRATSISLYPGDFYWYRVREQSLKSSKGIAQTACFMKNAVEMFRLVDVRNRFVSAQIRHTIGIFLARLCLIDDEEIPRYAVELGNSETRFVGFLMPGCDWAVRNRSREDMSKSLVRAKAELASAILSTIPAGPTRRLFVYCAGPIGEAVLNTLQRSGRIVEAVLDDNESLSGRSISGVTIRSSSMFRELSQDDRSQAFVFVCTQKATVFAKISNSLAEAGLHADQIAHWMF